MTAAPPPTPSRPGPGDPSVRRTWWLLAGAFALLALINGLRLANDRQPIDWLTVGLIAVAAVAAVAHRNAVAGLQTRGRSEAESFARILHGLSRSVSAEAIVAAIVEDLLDATAADHVVLVRRRRDGTALDATLVTRRKGVPSTTTALPLSLLDAPEEPVTAVAMARPVAAEPVAGEPVDPVGDGAVAAPASPGSTTAAPALQSPGGVTIETDHGRLVAVPMGEPPVTVGGPPLEVTEPVDGSAPPGAGPVPPDTGAVAPFQSVPTARGSRRASDPASTRVLLRRAAAEGLALLKDLGLPAPDVFRTGGIAKPAEVLARGPEAEIVERVAIRVQAAFGLSHTLAAPLRAERGLLGALVLSRRDRGAWPEAARRLLRGASTETAAALDRAMSHREAETSASTDPLTGLPNRRYFDEFSSLLATRRRAGDGVAVLMVDIDKFKGLNDAYGHPVGDQVLRSVATAITGAVRDHDIPARVGGEEFAVLLRNPGPTGAAEIGERVRQAVRDLDLRSIGVPGVSVSVGVADAASADEPIDSIVGRADRALLKAKRAGRDRVVAG